MGEMNEGLLRDGVAYVDHWLAYQQERRDLPGVVVGIRYRDEMLLLKGYGFADLERQTPMTPGHIFRIASHSKTFTATAVMQLVERGKLRLDDRLADHIPWLRDVDALAHVTVRQALNHTTGIVRDGSASDYWQLDGNFPDNDALRHFVEHGGAILDPNASFKYSNIAYGLLGMVIAASGQAYADYVMDHIVAPLGLADTGPDTDARVRDRLATGYTARRFGLPRRPIPDVPTGALASATGFYATAGDLCTYAAAHFFGDTTLLSDTSKREMQQPYWKVAHAEMHYGLGFAVYEIGKRRFIGHGGGFPGHATQTLIDPADRLVITVFTNEIAGPASLFAQGAAHVINLALQQEAMPEDARAERDRYTGRFASLWGVTDIAAFGNTPLMLYPEADNPARVVGRLAVEDDDTLRITESSGTGSPGETVRYIRDADGGIAKVIVGGGSAYPVSAYRERVQRRFG
jgi:D-alanyl-D-alanine carboxypeptidase